MKATANSMKASRRLRRQMSQPEVLLWQRLRGSPEGIRFRRQYAIGPFVANFYCPAAKLVIEVDGQVHGFRERAQRDAVRDTRIDGYGVRVLRILAGDVLKDADAVASAVFEMCAAGPLHHSTSPSGPPPHPCSAGRSE